MFLSVLIPVYNVEKYLEKCLESIVSQLPPDSEIVLMDDGSTDKSADICDRYATRYPGCIRTIHKKNEGLLITRRRLFQESKGQWILCVDSDDYLVPDALITLQALLTKRYSTVDILYFDADCIYLNGKRKRIEIDLIPGKIYEGESLKEVYIEKAVGYSLNHMWAKVFRREIIDFYNDYFGFESITLGEDSLQTYALLDNANRIVYINKTLYNYRKNKSGLTYHSYDKLYPMRVLLWPKESYYISKWKLQKPTIKKIMKKRVNEIINYLVAQIFNKNSYSFFQNECDRILDDGFLAEAVSYLIDDKHIKNRYITYATHLINREYKRVYYELCLEAMVFRLRVKNHE